MTNDTYCAYVLTFPNGKNYVGMCKEPAEHRWRNGYGYRGQKLVNNAIKKYGWKNVECKTPYRGLTKEEACAKEISLIKELNSNYLNGNQGYNMSDGGESGFRGGKHSAETRQILSELNSGENNAFYGKKHSAETRQKMKISSSKRVISEEARKRMRHSYSGELHPMFGKHHAEETKQKLSEANLGERHPQYGMRGRDNPHAKSFLCVETGKVFGCLSEISDELKCDVSHVSAVCTGKRRTACGYHWRHAN